METVKVKALMVPLDYYARVPEDATLAQAVLALEEAQEKFDDHYYKHRAVLVQDAEGRVIGKVGQLDVLKGLEPRFKEVGDLSMLSRFGFGSEFVKMMSRQFSLMEKPLNDICRKAAKVKVRDIMHTLTGGEYVDEEASVNEAIKQLVLGQHHSLLVTRGEEIVGILRLSDVFLEVCRLIKACELEG
jgi:CBS domain-containing protein